MPSSALLVLLLTLALGIPALAADPWVDYPGGAGPGAGKRIVLVSGDEEYRSEEALPQLGKILSRRHGFACRVVFAIDPESGEINPDVRTNIPGLEALADADLMIIATRFRDLPDLQMAHIDRYLRSGRPVIGLRTATHAFAIEGSDTFRHYTWNHADDAFRQGFGRQVLGETWVAHHGRHGSESTLGIVAPGAERHPVVRGIAPGSIWGPTDVYTVRLPLPDGCTPIVLGSVRAGMTPDAPAVTGSKNEPMMPIAWTKERAGTAPRPDLRPGRVFTTTMGAATDLVAEGTRRMLVNAAYWTLGMEAAIPPDGTDVRLVGAFRPTDFGFGGFRPGVRPADHALPAAESDTARFSLETEDRIVVVGGTFAERLAQSGLFAAVAHAAHPNARLVIREAPWSADEVGMRPREMNVPTMLDWVERLEADVVVMCFGMSESFTRTPDEFEAELDALVDTLGARERAPRLVLVSPIAHEIHPGVPADVSVHNARLAAITDRMRGVAGERGLAFVDLFDASRRAYASDEARLTTNGIHPNERGCARLVAAMARQLGWMPGPASAAAPPAAGGPEDELRTLAADSHWLFRLRYRPTNTEYVWGRRVKPFGVVNFPPEMAQLERMIAARDRALSAVPATSPERVVARALAAPAVWPLTPSRRVFPEDSWTPAPVEAKGTETSLGSLEIDDPDTFARSFSLPDGYVVECFASEQDFPELRNPLAMAFDARGRLWVLCTKTYPHLLPGERSECQLIILEDTDGNGRVDARTVFADELYFPTGFALDTDAVYVGVAPDLIRLIDTDGDDRADVTEIVASGFGMCDSHHQVSAFEWDPAGTILFHEGVFTKSSVETPYGTRRTRDAAVWRFDPRTDRLEIASHCNFSNPWGHAFDDYGASILADASGGANYSFSHVALPFDFPRKPKTAPPVLNRGRPTAGCELIASRHFPDDVQDSFLVNQSIGFHGTRWDRMSFQGSTWKPQSMPKDLLSTPDVNFRPVGMEIGPDGALYVLDWCNPIVGHMQYSIRDPRRDHTHGRVWRVRHRTRDLVTPPDVAGASVPELLELLRLPERNTRQLVRRRLQRTSWAVLQPALSLWMGRLRPEDPQFARLVLEDLWIRQAQGRATADHVARVMRLDEPRARAAAARAVRHLLEADALATGDALPLLEKAVDDPDMRVRLEGVVACGFLPPSEGVMIAARADLHAMDDAMTVIFEEVLAYLGRGGDVVSDVLERVKLARMPREALLARPLDEVGAIARLGRADLSRDDRREALVHLVGRDEDLQAARLAALLDTVRGDAALRTMGEDLLSMPDAALAARESSVRRLRTDPRPLHRAIGVGLALRRGDDDAVPDDPATLVTALELLAPGAAPPDAIRVVERAVETEAVDPTSAIEQVVRHRANDPDLSAWLAGLVEPVEHVSIQAWSGEHERAMAALRAMAERPSRGRPARYRVEPADEATWAAGEAIYHDEGIGCVRCHGVHGRGLEGYPPLDRSPWVLGDPHRAASIVVHGLYGPVRMPDGRVFNSVMEPLGDVLDDEQIAAVLTYVRQSWGNHASAVRPEQVAAVRASGPEQGGTWEERALRMRYPMWRDVLVAGETEVASRGLGFWLRQFVFYMVPPLLMAGAVIGVLSRGDRAA